MSKICRALLAIVLFASCAHASPPMVPADQLLFHVSNVSQVVAPTATPTVTVTPTVTPTSAGCSAEPAFVQSPGGFSGTTTCAKTFGVNNTAGNFIAVGIWIESTTATITGVADTRSNTYSAATGYSDTSFSSGRMIIYYAPNIASGANVVTVTASAAVRVNCHVTEYSGVATASPVDVTASGTAADDPTTGAAVTTQAKDLIYAFIANNGGDATPGGSLVSRPTYVFNQYSQSADYKQASAGSTNESWTTVSTAQGITQFAAFKCKP